MINTTYWLFQGLYSKHRRVKLAALRLVDEFGEGLPHNPLGCLNLT
jgi:hypothetical protein